MLELAKKLRKKWNFCELDTENCVSKFLFQEQQQYIFALKGNLI